MEILKVESLCKNYPSFRLENVSFSIEKGHIAGFIGRNGAGKTTTLKSILGFLHTDGGEVGFFGKNFRDAEQEIKQQVGYVSGGVRFYPSKKLKTISAVTAEFYENWDDAAYRRYMQRFELDENKTPAQLSDGMRVKYALTLALSHHARLLILDEPTSGLDPVSREELMRIFIELKNEGVTILFSTHITSELDKCADDIIYIKKGRILAAQTLESFKNDPKYAHLGENGKIDLESIMVSIELDGEAE